MNIPRIRRDLLPRVGRPVWNSALYTLGNIAPQVANVLLLPVFTRLLSREEYGIFGYTTAISTFLGIVGTLSIHSYALRHYFECRDDDERRRLFGALFWFLAAYAAALLAVERIVLPVVFRAYALKVPFEPFMRLALYNVAIESLATIPLSYFRVREQAGKFMALVLGQFVLSIGVTLYLIVVLRIGVLGRYYGQLSGNLVMLCVYVAVIARVSSFAWDSRLIWKALTFSAPMALSGLFAVFSSMFDRIVLERYVSLAQLGIYTVGFSIAYGLNSLSNGIYKAIEPVIYRMAGEVDFDAGVVKVKRYLVVLLTLIGCSVVALAHEIIAVLANPQFRESYRILALVGVRAVLMGITIPAAVYTVALKRTASVAAVELAGAVIGVVGNLLLIPRFGIIGAATSGILSAFCVLLAYALVTERYATVRWGYATDLAWGTAVFVAAAAIQRVETPSLVGTIAIKCALLSIVALIWYSVRWSRSPKPLQSAAHARYSSPTP